MENRIATGYCEVGNAFEDVTTKITPTKIQIGTEI